MRSIIFVLLVTATLIHSTRVQLPCTARDFTPQTCSDFGRSSYSTDNNIPRGYLDHDNKPCDSGSSHSTVQSLQSFSQWFRDTQGVNRNLPVNLDCNHNDNTGVTSYYNNQFWPCDNRGYGNYGNTGHNCHYTTEHHHNFCYTGGEQFNCTSNSDVFVYIAGQLVINFGGVSSERTGNCRLDSLGLKVGSTYTISIFHAQRDTRSCSFGFSTDCNIHNPVCPSSSTTGRPAAPLTTGARSLTTGKALPLTTGRALPSTTGAITSSALSTASITSSAITSAALTTASLSTSAITSSAITSASWTSAALTTEQITSSRLTTSAITSGSWTSAAITSAALTTNALTTSPITSSAWTSAAITSASVTSSAVTSSAMTTNEMTTASMTTSPMTTQEISTSAITSAALTTGSVPISPPVTPPAASTTGFVSPPPTPGNNNYTNNVTEPGRCIYICEVEFCDFCPGVALNDLENCPAAPVLSFANGKTETFDQFNAISFGSFYTTLSGDVEGRIAVRNNLGLPNGAYSVGYEIRSGGAAAIDAPQPFSVVVGHDATWTSGAVYPLGNNIPYEAAQEFMYVGGSFTGPQDLKDVVVSGSSLGMNSGSLDAAFDQARAYYIVVGTSFNTGKNVGGSVTVDSTGLFTLTCDSTSTLSVSVQVTGAQITATNTWAKVNCADQVQIVFNIIGSDDFTFSGNNLNHRAERVLYNILGTRTVTVQTEVRGNMLMPSSTLNQLSGVIKGIVIAVDIVSVLQINRDNCVVVGQPPIVPPETVICPAYETQCEGLIFPLKGSVYSFRDFNVISFNNFVGKSGDVEGRVAARNNCDCLGGYSVGYQLSTAGGGPDNSLPYSLVCGQNLNFPGGAVYPDGSGVPHAGAQENIFTGSNFTGPAYLAAQVTGSCASEQPGCLNQYFDAAETCYSGYSNTLAALPDNTVTQYYWSGMFINCTSNSSSQYVVSVDGAQLSGSTYYVTNNCNFQAQWVINVRGTSDVQITGGSFPGVPGGIVYNILGSRSIYVHDTNLVGNVLAPSATLNMTTGVINGKVVVGNVVNSLQINREGQCPVPTSVTVATVSTNSCPAGTNSIYVANPLAFQINDQVNDKENNTYTITGIYPLSVSVTPSLVRLISQQELIHYTANTAASRTMVQYNATNNENNHINGAGQMAASLVVMAIIALFI